MEAKLVHSDTLVSFATSQLTLGRALGAHSSRWIPIRMSLVSFEMQVTCLHDPDGSCPCASHPNGVTSLAPRRTLTTGGGALKRKTSALEGSNASKWYHNNLASVDNFGALNKNHRAMYRLRTSFPYPGRFGHSSPSFRLSTSHFSDSLRSVLRSVLLLPPLASSLRLAQNQLQCGYAYSGSRGRVRDADLSNGRQTPNRYNRALNLGHK
jgi:hypothetical protein